jgi:hypothetical protein
MSATDERSAAERVTVRADAERQAPAPGRDRIRSTAWRELAVAWLLLGLLGVLAFGPYVRDGGFYMDDWSNAAGAFYPPGSGGFGAAVSFFRELTAYRPLLVVYVPLEYEVFGMHMGLHLAWAATLGIAVSGLLYAVLRTVGLPRLDAWLLAALVLVFPWFDSLRMWMTASQVTLGVAFYLAGLWVALVALRRRSWPLHAASLLLFATSLLTYEIALALIAASGLLYVALVGWRAARLRWGADLVVAFAGAIWVASQTKRATSGLSEDLRHLKEIFLGGGTLLGRAVIAVGPQRTTLALAAIGCAALLALAAWRRDRGAAAPGASMTRWLLLGAAGLVIAACGWAPFIPADPYYTPSVFGMTNRVNGLAGIGLVFVVYAGCGVAGSLAVRLGARSPAVGRTVTALLACLLGFTYLHVVDRHAAIWERAFHAEMAGLGQLKTQFPDLPDGTTLFTSGYPANQTLGVPIFGARWDLDGAVKVQYHNGSLRAYPVLPGTRLVCDRAGVRLVGPGMEGIEASFPTARFIDVGSGRTAAPRDVAECRRTAPLFVPGPLYVTLDY